MGSPNGSKTTKTLEIEKMESSVRAPSIFTVKGFLILDNVGRRILAYYFDEEIKRKSSDFERRLFKKTKSTNVEILLLDDMVISYKPGVDPYFYVIGPSYENELMLNSVLNCYYDSLNILMRREVEKKCLFQHLRICLLAIDEICDNGVIFCVDPHEVARNVQSLDLKSEDISTNLGEQTVSKVISLLTRNS